MSPHPHSARARTSHQQKREADRTLARARQQPSEEQLREYVDCILEQPGVDLDGLTLRMVVSQVEQRHGMVLGV